MMIYLLTHSRSKGEIGNLIFRAYPETEIAKRAAEKAAVDAGAVNSVVWKFIPTIAEYGAWLGEFSYFWMYRRETRYIWVIPVEVGGDA